MKGFIVTKTEGSIWLVILLTIVPTLAIGQTTLPGRIRLVAGYQFEAIQAVDSGVGRIFKQGGPEFYCEFGLIGNPITRIAPERLKWLKEEDWGGWIVQIALTTDDELNVVFLAKVNRAPVGTIHGKVRSPEDIADLFLIAFSFPPRAGP